MVPAPDPASSPAQDSAPVDAAAPTPMAPDAYARRARSTLFNVLLAIGLGLMALATIQAVVEGLGSLAQAQSAPSDDSTQGRGLNPATLWAAFGFQFFLVGVLPFLWVVATRRRPWEGAVRYLGLRSPARSLFVGVGLGGLLLGGLFVVMLIHSMLPAPLRSALEGSVARGDSVILDVMTSLTWPLAIFMSLAAGVGEEILFRGILQRWVGIWGQAVLFVAAHMSNGMPLQWAIALVIGVLFGYLRRAGWSLGVLMVAHATYDLFLMAAYLADKSVPGLR